MKAVVRYVLFWLKYFDYLLANTKAGVDAAAGTYFLGRRSSEVKTDREILLVYKGAVDVAGAQNLRQVASGERVDAFLGHDNLAVAPQQEHAGAAFLSDVAMHGGDNVELAVAVKIGSGQREAITGFLICAVAAIFWMNIHLHTLKWTR